MNDVKLSLNLVNQVLAYLGSRPYQEVFGLINSIQEEAKNQVLDSNSDQGAKED
jgi:hypothetical protein